MQLSRSRARYARRSMSAAPAERRSIARSFSHCPISLLDELRPVGLERVPPGTAWVEPGSQYPGQRGHDHVLPLAAGNARIYAIAMVRLRTPRHDPLAKLGGSSG